MKKLVGILVEMLIGIVLTTGAKATTITGTARDAAGTGINGTIVFRLSYPAKDNSTSTFVTPGAITYPLRNGKPPSYATVIGNDQLTPSGTVYVTEFRDAYNMLIARNAYNITGASFDIGAAVPTAFTTSNVSFQDLLGLRTLSVKSFRNTRYAEQYTAGADMLAKILLAQADLPAGGGDIDATAFVGAQACTGGTLGTAAKPVRLFLSAGMTMTCTGVLTVGLASQIIGAGGNSNGTGTIIIGKHTGIAVVSLLGAQFDTLQNITIQGDSGTTPMTGLLLARNSSASAGLHRIGPGVYVTGFYSKAVIYNVASETNVFDGVYARLDGGGAAHVFHASQTDDLGVCVACLPGGVGIVGSSNLSGTVTNSTFINVAGSGAGGSCIYMNLGSASASWLFSSNYLIKDAGGDYVDLNVIANAQDLMGPLTFINNSGEKSGAGPDDAFLIRGTISIVLRGLTILGGGKLGANNFFIRVPSTINNIEISGSLIEADYPNKDDAPTYPPTALNSQFWKVSHSKLNFPYGTVAFAGTGADCVNNHIQAAVQPTYAGINSCFVMTPASTAMNGVVQIASTTVGQDAFLQIVPISTGQQTRIDLYSGAALKWQVGKDISDNFFINGAAAPVGNILSTAAGGGTTLAAFGAGKNVVLTPGPTGGVVTTGAQINSSLATGTNPLIVSSATPSNLVVQIIQNGTINNGINGQATSGSGFKHQRVAGCTPAGGINLSCDTTVTWTGTAFADANYTAVATCETPTNFPVITTKSRVAGAGATIVVTTENSTALAANCALIDIIAVHD